MHCGKVLILENIPGPPRKSLTCSHRKIFMLNILKISHVYPHFSGWKVNFLVEPFPQCTRYIHILIYIKGSNVLQTAICVYIHIL